MKQDAPRAEKPYSRNDPEVQQFIAYLVNSGEDVPELDSAEFHERFANWSSWGMTRDEVG